MSPNGTLPGEVESAAASALGLADGDNPFLDIHRLGGGCIHPSVRLRTRRGEEFFLKWSKGSGAGGFTLEAEGLRALAEIEGGPRIPTVLAAEDGDADSCGWLLLEFIEEGRPTARTAAQLGEALASMHGSRADPLPGWHRDGFIGSLPQRNGASGASWPRFWVEARLEPQWKRARRHFDPETAHAWSRLLPRIEAALQGWEEDGVSLLHGDLWSGNVLTDQSGEPVLIDPAAYRGHREVDLAMMELFGGFRERTFARYREIAPLRPGYPERRRDIYQLYPLLVHVNLFGASYIGSVRDRLLRLLQELD
ncbi:MAG: fructosamine kinase family protein [Gemmatimonadota bacterium]